MRPAVAILLACHNRRARTLACLASVSAQTADADLHLIVFDDGSTDGTAAAVRAAYPQAEIIAGSGDAYWAGGMRAAFDRAIARDIDFSLWLNDDVVLASDALSRLLAAHAALAANGRSFALLGGALADPATGRTTYHGVLRRLGAGPLRFDRCEPDPNGLRACDTLHGNVVLVPRDTARRIGSIDAAYVHTLGDLDYGLRVGRAGGWVGLAPGHLGWCSPNTVADRWFNPALGLRRRWCLVRHPLGFPLRPWLHFARAHGGPAWMRFVLHPYWRLLVPPGLASRLREARAHSGPSERPANAR